MNDDKRDPGDGSGSSSSRGKRDGIATIRLRHDRRARAISRAGAIALVVSTVAIGLYVAYFV